MSVGHHVPESECSSCARMLDGAFEINSDVAPQPGDLSVCIYCAAVNVFDDELHHRAPTPLELIAAIRNPEVRRARQAVLQLPRGKIEPN